MDDICPICLDTWMDPIICADGYCYCRRCIARWVGGDRMWTSLERDLPDPFENPQTQNAQH